MSQDQDRIVQQQKRKRIVVVGSANVDVSLRVERIPGPGETLLASDMIVGGGGKGGNQATAAARLGGDVVFCGCLGDDGPGRLLRDNFAAAGVGLDGVLTDPEKPTGQAFIYVADDGENNIVVVAGANQSLTPERIDSLRPLLEDASFVAAQLEIPLASVERLAAVCRELNVPFILNPSPAAALPASLLENVSILVPNEHELAVLSGQSDEAAGLAALFARGIETIVLTQGSRGVLLATPLAATHYPALKRDVVDTTGAGDTFLGGLLVALAEQRGWPEAVAFAQEAAGIAVTRRGAQDSIPLRAEVDAALKARRNGR